MAMRWICFLLFFVSKPGSSYQDQCELRWTTFVCDGSRMNVTTFPPLEVCGVYRNLHVVKTNLTDLQSGDVILPQCSGLVALDFSFNGIRILNPSFLKNNPAIEMLKLVGNNLRSVPKDILAGALLLEYIDLSNNFIGVIEEFSFGQNKFLKYLGLRNNGIYSINRNAFSGLDGLHYLHLSNNFITEFPFRESGYNFSQLQFLALTNNNISRLLATTDFYASETIKLDENLLQSVEGFSLEGFSVSFLNLQSNIISRLDTFMFGNSPHNLTSLTLKLNLLTEIPVLVLRQLPKLTYLNLGYNRLTRIPKEAFRDNHYLATITLSDNYIHEVHPMALVGLHGLKTLNLRRNRLSAIPFALFNSSTYFQIQLSGNNWTCDCEAYPILEWVQKSEYFVDDIECGTTDYEKASFLLDFPFEEICSMTESSNDVSTSTSPLTTDIPVIDEETQTNDVMDISSGRQDRRQITSHLLFLLLLLISVL